MIFTSRVHIVFYIFLGLVACSNLHASQNHYYDEYEAIEILRSGHPDFQGAIPIWQGATDLHSTQISYLTEGNQILKVYAKSKMDGQTYLPIEHRILRRPDSQYAIGKVVFAGLPQTHRFNLIVTTADNKVVDQRNFSMLNTQNMEARIAVASCMYDLFHRPVLWENLIAVKPDVIFLVGDNVYADRISLTETRIADPHQLWYRFAKTFFRLAIYRSKNLIPILATWDDHDYGANNSDRTYIYRNEAIQNFYSFWGQNADQNLSIENGPGVSMVFKAFGQEFYFLDDRSFRDPKSVPNRRFFGDLQEAWLYSEMQTSSTPAWLISGNQFFGAYLGKESFEGYAPENFNRFLNNLKMLDRPIGFISGDTHFSEIMSLESPLLGRPSLEITSSSMHSFTIPGHQWRRENPRRIAATGYHNFVVLDLYSNGLQLVGRTTALTRNFDIQYQYDFHLK